ncbi:MAG: hydantoinase/oxoprolinase N-terminal domain-containing protein, partial [Gemmatimonadales bacterium]
MRLGVDVGGTFTDLVAVAADGAMHVRKVLSTPDDPAIGLFEAVDRFRGTAPEGPAPIDVLVHGTTVATNALLERRGARLALVTTRGFEDLLWLRRQDRAALYDLARDHPPPLVARDRVVGAAERMGADGPVVRLTEREVTRVVRAVRRLRPEAVAVALLFAFRHPAHEARLAAALR